MAVTPRRHTGAVMPGDKEAERLALYAYATAPESGAYISIMAMLAGALLAEWSAAELAERGLDLPVQVIDERLRYLERHGNLLASPREVRVTSIAEYQRQPARYAATSLGIRVHRQVEEVLAAAGGAREVPRELLAAIAHRLTTLAAMSATELASADPAEVAEAVSTLFIQFETFAGAVTDFYSYVGSVLARADLDDEEWLGFKHLLLDYLETIVESVTRHSAAIRLALARLEPLVPVVIERAPAADPAAEALRASSPGGEAFERARGRSTADWDELRGWFAGGGTGRPAQAGCGSDRGILGSGPGLDHGPAGPRRSRGARDRRPPRRRTLTPLLYSVRLSHYVRPRQDHSTAGLGGCQPRCPVVGM